MISTVNENIFSIKKNVASNEKTAFLTILMIIPNDLLLYQIIQFIQFW